MMGRVFGFDGHVVCATAMHDSHQSEVYPTCLGIDDP
jgi:hypothetical protein